MPTLYPEVCLYCKYLFNENDKQDNYKCKAFPEGVPKEIYQGKYDHRNPYPNDSGIRFELRNDLTVHQDEVNRMFKVIEDVRKTNFNDPMKINPTPYDWWKVKSEEKDSASSGATNEE